MANYAEFRDPLTAIITNLKRISLQTNGSACCAATTSAGVNIPIPANFSSVSIVKTSPTGTVNVTMSDGTVFPMTVQGEVLVHSAGNNKYLPAYPIATPDGATWKWTAVK
jgi:hypothetical protein